MAYQLLTQIDGELPSSQRSKRFVLLLSRMANALANMNIWTARGIHPKWRLDSEYCHLGLLPRSSSVCPLLTNISRVISLSLPISHEYQYLTSILRMLTNACQCLRKSRRMTVFATFAEINKPVCKLSDRRKKVGSNLWTFRICYQRLRSHCGCCEFR